MKKMWFIDIGYGLVSNRPFQGSGHVSYIVVFYALKKHLYMGSTF